MSRRNFILLIIVSVIAVIFLFAFFFMRSTPTPGETGESGGFFGFNPFGGIKTVSPTTPASPEAEETIPPEEMAKMKLVKVSTMPIAGFTVFKKEKEEKEFIPALRYVDRATGNIYQTFADEIKERKFSGTIIPMVYEALFGNNGEIVVMRYLKNDDRTIQTFLGNLPKEILGEDTIAEKEITGSFLPENISDLSLSFDATKVFYLLNLNESVSGIILNLKDNKKTQIFDSSFTEWLSSWPNSKMIILNTKPSGTTLGYLYALDPVKKTFNRILDGINGLTALVSPDGKSVLSGGANLALNIFRLDTREATPLGISSLPEKCVWGKLSDVLYCAVPKLINPGLYPDSWYKGEVSFSDEIWKINPESGNMTKIIDPASIVFEEIDGIKLALDEGENYLFFVNKKDSYLWKLDLK